MVINLWHFIKISLKFSMAIQNFTIQIILTLTAIDLKFGHSQNMEINRYFYADIKKKNIKKKIDKKHQICQ